MMFHAFQDERHAAAEQVIAEFDMWQALDAMARFAHGEASFGAALEPPAASGKPASYAPPGWARDFTVSVRADPPAQVQASFTNEAMLVAAAVTLMLPRG